MGLADIACGLYGCFLSTCLWLWCVQDDARTLLQQGEAAVAAAISVLSRGGAVAAATAAAEAAAAEASLLSATANGEASSEVDEFGRNVGLMRKREVHEGADRRQAIIAAQQQQLQHISNGECCCVL